MLIHLSIFDCTYVPYVFTQLFEKIKMFQRNWQSMFANYFLYLVVLLSLTLAH